MKIKGRVDSKVKSAVAVESTLNSSQIRFLRRLQLVLSFTAPATRFNRLVRENIGDYVRVIQYKEREARLAAKFESVMKPKYDAYTKRVERADKKFASAERRRERQ